MYPTMSVNITTSRHSVWCNSTVWSLDN